MLDSRRRPRLGWGGRDAGSVRPPGRRAPAPCSIVRAGARSLSLLPRRWQTLEFGTTLAHLQAMGAVAEGPRELLVMIARAEPNGVLVTVKDSGPGLDPTSLDRLFAPFYTTKPGGLGMGLSICRSIIESHGGRLLASTVVDRGSVFSMRLPAYRPGAE